MAAPLLPEQEQQIAQTRDAAIRQAHIDCEKAFADADYTWGVIVYTAAKTLAFTDAEATYNTIALAAEKAQGMRDTIAEMNYWIRDQKITAEYNKLVATAESAEKRARDEADAAHKEAQSQINAAYDLVSMKPMRMIRTRRKNHPYLSTCSHLLQVFSIRPPHNGNWPKRN